jgi:hypothetical protein
MIFVATNDPKLLQALKRTDHTTMARSLNLKVVAQARGTLGEGKPKRRFVGGGEGKPAGHAA